MDENLEQLGSLFNISSNDNNEFDEKSRRISVAVLILRILKSNPNVSYSELKEHMVQTYGEEKANQILDDVNMVLEECANIKTTYYSGKTSHR